MGKLINRISLVLAVSLTMALGASAQKGAAPKQDQARIVEARDCLDTIEEYINARKEGLAIRGKALDVFGLNQNPKKNNNILPDKQPQRQIVKLTPLSHLLKMLEINMIMPARGSFRIGARTVKIGDRLPVTFNEEVSILVVEAVTNDGVIFTRKDTQERAKKVIAKLPPGVTRGGDKEHGKGIMSLNDVEQKPIDLNQSRPAGSEGPQLGKQ